MTETVFTYGAPALKFGAGASAEVGHDLASYGARRVLLVTDAGVAATGHPARIAEQVTARGLEVVVFDRARVEPTDESLVEAVEFARDAGPFDAVLAVGGGSSIDTAKAVALLLTNPGELMDYVNAPVGKARAPVNPLLPLVAVPTTTGHRQREHDDLRARRAVAAREDRDQPPGAPAAARRGRPDADADSAGDGDRRRRHGHPVPRAGELDRALVRRLRRQAARAAGALLRRQPDRRPVVRAGPDAAGRRLPDGRPRRLGRRRRASRWRWPPPSPAWASATPGCTSRTRTPTRSPGRVRDYRPPGYPDDAPIVPHGMAVSLTAPAGVPVHLRGRPGAAPAGGPDPRPRRGRRRARRRSRTCSPR